MKLAEWSVRNSLLVNMLTIFTIFAGILAVFANRREAFPNFSFDIVQISTRYPGATASQIEKLITIPLEKELKEVDDIKDLVSASTEGFSYIYAVIESDAPNKDKTVNDIQRAVDRAEDLPADLKDKPVVEEISTKNTPMLEVALFGDLPPEELRQLSRRLETLLLDDPNVAKVIRRGYREPEFSVEVNPSEMARYHLSLADVIEALRATNINFPGGDIRQDGQEFLLRVSGEFYKPDEIENVVVRSNSSGYHVRVKDIGRVVPTLEKITITNRANGHDAINLLILKKEKADIIHLVDDVKKIIADFKATAPPALGITIVNDISRYVEMRLDVLVNNALIGLVLLFIPLVIFLSPRTAISAAIGIPTAVMAAFALMHFFGITINLMSLFGLIMVAGMLVDEDIVIAENVYRLMEEGVPPRKAAIDGTKQVAKSVIATVLTTVTCFAPLLAMTGIFGKFVKQIPQVIIITLAASLIQALLVLPSHIYDLNDMSEEKARKHFERARKSWGNRFMNGLLRVYEAVLRPLVRHRYITAGIFLILMAATFVFGFQKVPFVLFPSEGVEQFFVRVETEMGTPVEVTTERMTQIEKVLQKLPKGELEHIVTQGGLTQNDPTDPFTERSSHIGQVWVFLTPEPQRQRKAAEIMESIRPEVEKIPGFTKLSFEEIQNGPPVGKPVSVHIRGDDFELLNKVGEQYVAYLKTLPGVKDIKSDYQPGKKELRAVIDEVRMRQAGLTHQDVASAVRSSFEGGIATTIKDGDEEIDVLVRFPENLRKDKASLESVLVPNREGRLIPLLQIASFKEEAALTVIKHDDRKRVVTVSANLDQKVTTSGKVNAKLDDHFKESLKKEAGVSVKYGGEEEDTEEAMKALFRAMLLALFLTFIIIAATFRSLWEPFVVMTTIPMGMMGVIYGFYLFDKPISFLGLLGVIGFAGVIVDSALLIVEFINIEKAKGTHFKEAIIRGSRARLRPVLLTTATTVLGIVPSAFGLGGTDPFIQPMAFAMNWGLSVGTVFSVLMIPVFLAILYDVVGRLKKADDAREEISATG